MGEHLKGNMMPAHGLPVEMVPSDRLKRQTFSSSSPELVLE
jgi:hypothetical protein